ncbi:MAG TPA: ABC-F family ATP-binding cassette domain-containing protein [Mycobacteriales bacterium]|nr:ABC-F family ATP-binding cassette domain-containing protein [Mycobacteriales bacterium]
MLTVHGLEVRAGARLLLAGAELTVGPGDRVGMVGRNGAGKTTLTRLLAGEGQPAAGTITISGSVGYLPQEAKVGDLTATALDRVLSARGLDVLVKDMAKAQIEMAECVTEDDTAAAIRRYGRLEERFVAAGGYDAEHQAATICASLGLPARVLEQQLGTLSGGQRRRVELARILFSDAELLLLDEPTNHLDADSILWLRDFLRQHQGGLVVISHDVNLLDHVVTKVVHLDATRSTLDVYNLGWKAYLKARETDEKRRRRERAHAERQIGVMKAQADRMRASATRSRQAQGLDRRAARLAAGLEDVRAADRVAKLRFPTPAPCGRVPLTAEGLSKAYGSLEIFTGIDLAIDRGARVVILGLNGAGKTTLLRLLAGVETPDTGSALPGHGLRLGYFAQEHDTLDPERSVLENLQSANPESTDADLRALAGAFLFSGDVVHQPAGTLSGGEKTRLALACLVGSAANVLLLDEPTNNLDPASRDEILAALRSYQGAVLLVTHDEGAVRALQPERVLLLPDGTEDLWSEELLDLVALA